MGARKCCSRRDSMYYTGRAGQADQRKDYGEGYFLRDYKLLEN